MNLIERFTDRLTASARVRAFVKRKIVREKSPTREEASAQFVDSGGNR